MDVLVIGGTRFFGIPMVEELIRRGANVTIATRGMTADSFGDRVDRLTLDLNAEESVRKALNHRHYNVVINKMGYGSNEIKWILESVACDRFIHMSTAGVYRLDHHEIAEEEFDGNSGELVWCRRGDLPYDEVKRNAERALCQAFPGCKSVCVRVPFVLGERDYTRRLYFYVEHVLTGKAMYIDNMDERFCVAQCREIGEFLAFLADSAFTGPINGCSGGLVSVRDILRYIEYRTGFPVRTDRLGDPAPYNGTRDNSLCTMKARALGFHFMDVHEWLYQLIDKYIDEVNDGRGR